jgi:hypothetical protein
LSVDKLSVDKLSVDKLSVDELSVDELSVDELSVDELSVDELSVDELKWRRFQISAKDVPLIVVGGGAILIDRDCPFQGVSRLVIPDHYQVDGRGGAEKPGLCFSQSKK